MPHISEIGLFDYLAGKTDLSVQEIEHLQDCDDCRDEAVLLRRAIQDCGDIERARRFLLEEGKLPVGTQDSVETDSVETGEPQRELGGRSES